MSAQNTVDRVRPASVQQEREQRCDRHAALAGALPARRRLHLLRHRADELPGPRESQAHLQQLQHLVSSRTRSSVSRELSHLFVRVT